MVNLRKQWRDLKKDPPGSRFRLRYERRKRERRTVVARVAWTSLALVLIVGGIVLLPVPGPGILVIIAGVALLAEESLAAARALDRIEARLRGIPATRS